MKVLSTGTIFRTAERIEKEFIEQEKKMIEAGLEPPFVRCRQGNDYFLTTQAKYDEYMIAYEKVQNMTKEEKMEYYRQKLAEQPTTEDLK
jgi:hypothetical protein